MLTSKVIKELKPKEKRYQITDSDGLALRIQRSGVKSWVLRVPQNGRIVDITLGHWPEVTLQHARALARQRKKELELDKWLHEQNVFRNRLVAHGLRSIGRSWFADNDVPNENSRI